MSHKKCYDTIHTEDMRADIMQLEKYMEMMEGNIWADENERVYLMKVKDLDLSSRRLWLVFVLLNQSIIKTARYFSVDRKTISTAIQQIKIRLDLV